MEEGDENLDPRKSTVAMFVILVVIVALVLVIEWMFNFFRERM